MPGHAFCHIHSLNEVMRDLYVYQMSMLLQYCMLNVCVCFVCVGVDFYSRMIRLEDKTIFLQLWDMAAQERCVTTLQS